MLKYVKPQLSNFAESRECIVLLIFGILNCSTNKNDGQEVRITNATIYDRHKPALLIAEYKTREEFVFQRHEQL